MRIEKDRIEFICGVRKGKTLGNPLGLLIWNKDWENWKDIMASEPGPPSTERVVTRPRPGHADLVGAIKYGHRDIRNVLEKASARETAIRVAIGGVAKSLLAQFGMRVVSYTMDIGGVAAPSPNDPLSAYEHAEQSDVRCHDPETAKKMSGGHECSDWVGNLCSMGSASECSFGVCCDEYSSYERGRNWNGL